MDYSSLQKDILQHLRGGRSQDKVSKRLGFGFNQIYRWESGVTQLRWIDFVNLCEVYKAKLPASIKECFGYFEDLRDSAKLTRHFIAKNPQSLIASQLGVSRSNVSRWLKGSLVPSLPQMLALMDFASADIFRFIEMLTGTQELPSVQQELKLERKQSEIYYHFPWVSAVLSAIGMDEYQNNPSDEFLAKKSKLPLKVVKKTLAGLEEALLLYWKENKWVARVYRNSVGINREALIRCHRYNLARAADGLEAAAPKSTPGLRISGKMFSLNQAHYEKILQCYNEFFNELGTLIDAGQDESDKIYLFSMSFIDFDFLPVESREDFSKKM
jgi:transcriptional regulator with XRE-family HTH domain